MKYYVNYSNFNSGTDEFVVISPVNDTVRNHFESCGIRKVGLVFFRHGYSNANVYTDRKQRGGTRPLIKGVQTLFKGAQQGLKTVIKGVRKIFEVDASLTTYGIRQSKCISDTLKLKQDQGQGINFQLVFSSCLSRAQMTAVTQFSHIPNSKVYVIPYINELHNSGDKFFFPLSDNKPLKTPFDQYYRKLQGIDYLIKNYKEGQPIDKHPIEIDYSLGINQFNEENKYTIEYPRIMFQEGNITDFLNNLYFFLEKLIEKGHIFNHYEGVLNIAVVCHGGLIRSLNNKLVKNPHITHEMGNNAMFFLRRQDPQNTPLRVLQRDDKVSEEQHKEGKQPIMKMEEITIPNYVNYEFMTVQKEISDGLEHYKSNEYSKLLELDEFFNLIKNPDLIRNYQLDTITKGFYNGKLKTLDTNDAFENEEVPNQEV
jgi:broad specificity phosphatase PhoE